VLENVQYFFNAAVYENGTDKCLKDVAHYFAGLKDFDLPVIHLEILFERVADVAIEVVLLTHLLLLLLALPVRHLGRVL